MRGILEPRYFFINRKTVNNGNRDPSNHFVLSGYNLEASPRLLQLRDPRVERFISAGRVFMCSAEGLQLHYYSSSSVTRLMANVTTE
jgi:hypothetical protein